MATTATRTRTAGRPTSERPVAESTRATAAPGASTSEPSSTRTPPIASSSVLLSPTSASPLSPSSNSASSSPPTASVPTTTLASASASTNSSLSSSNPSSGPSSTSSLSTSVTASSSGEASGGPTSLSVLPPTTSSSASSLSTPRTSSAPGIQPPSALSDDSLSGGQIAGIVVGTLLGFLALCLLLFVICLRRRKRRGAGGYASSGTGDTDLNSGWEDLGPSGSGPGATGGAWARNGGSGLGSEARERYMSESGQGFAYARSRAIPPPIRTDTGESDRDANEAGILAGTDPTRQRRWDPTIRAWREVVPSSPHATPQQRRAVGGTMRDGRDSPDTGVSGQTADRASALEGIYGALLGSLSRSRSGLSTRMIEGEEASPLVRRYRDDDDDGDREEEVLAYRRGGSSVGSMEPPQRPSLPSRSAAGDSSSSDSGTGTGTGSGSGSAFTNSTMSSRSIGLGLPSAVAAGRLSGKPARLSGDVPQRRLSRKRVPTPEELDPIYSPPGRQARERERTSSFPHHLLSEESSVGGSPLDIAAAMFPMPPPSLRAPTPGPSGTGRRSTPRDSTTMASGSGSGSDDVVVFQGYGAGSASSRDRKDAALRGRGGPGRRILSASAQESHEGSGYSSTGRRSPGRRRALNGSRFPKPTIPEARPLTMSPAGSQLGGKRPMRGGNDSSGTNSASGNQDTTSTQSYNLPPDEDLFYVQPSEQHSAEVEPSESSYSEYGLAERQLPPAGQTRPYVQSNYPGLGGDGSARTSPAASRNQLNPVAAGGLSRSGTNSSFVTSRSATAGQPPARTNSGSSAWRRSRSSGGQTIATSDQAWSVRGGSSRRTSGSPDLGAGDRSSGVYRKSSRRAASDPEGSQRGSMIGGVLAGLGLGGLFGARRRSGYRPEMAESSTSR